MNVSMARPWSPICMLGSLTGGLSLAFVVLAIPLAAHAGKIISGPSASGAAGFGGWNLENVLVVLDGTQGAVGSSESWFDPTDGAYNFGIDSDLSYRADVFDEFSTIMGIALAKDWPVGEPSGIKIVHDDTGVRPPKPQNCIMATSYLAGHLLDSAEPEQVTCSSPFQSHKRYKLAMLPSTVDGMGSEGVDLVFNVEAEEGSREYQVFQKINNWTDGRLAGFTIEVGFGIGDDFQTVAASSVDLEELNISVPSEIWNVNQLAVFSAGLFGPFDDRTGLTGFFDPVDRAGFVIDEYGVGPQPLTSTLTATTTLGSDYAEVPIGANVANQFGPWLPNSMLPYGIFVDDDGNPDTDALLLAWYGYNPTSLDLGWMGGSQDPDGPFAEISDSEIEALSEDLSATMGEIDDLVNVGINYIVSIGDVTTFPGTTFTIRITPTPDSSGTPPPTFVGADPFPPLLFSSSDGVVLLQPDPTFEVGDVLTARVGDADLNLDPMVVDLVDVEIASASAPTAMLTLVEQGANRGVFAALLPPDFGEGAIGTTVTMTYQDADIGTGVSETKMAVITVPEPSDLVMMLAALATVGVIVARRQRVCG